MKRALVIVLLLVASCRAKSGGSGIGPNDTTPTPVGNVGEDNTAKESPRLMPAEAYIRTYLAIFGGLSPIAAQSQLQGNQLFDTWDDYLASIGMPDYTADIPRGAQTNALMIAAFERMGVALCDRSLEHDLAISDPTQRLIYAFDLSAPPANATAFAASFDVMHRTFLSYPASMAPTDRTNRFYSLYNGTLAAHSTGTSLFTPNQAAWATVCYGLVRHPEFHLY